MAEKAPERPVAVLPAIRAHMAILPVALKRIGKYVLENPDLVVRQSAAELGLMTTSGQASVVRFCRAIGFTGFTELKLALAGDLAKLPIGAEAPGRDAGMKLSDALTDNLVRAVRETQLLIDHDALETIAARLALARRIDIYGAGVSGLVAQYLGFRLLRLGLPAHAIVDPTFAAEIASGLGPSSAAIAISESGLTQSTADALRRARAAGALTAVITHRRDGPVARHADKVLLTSSVVSPLTGGALTLAFTHLMIIEMLVASLTLRLGLVPDPALEDYSKRLSSI